MKSFWKLGIGTAAIVVAGLGVAVMLPASEAQAAVAPPTTYRTAYASNFDPNTFTFTFVDIWQGPDFFTGETVTTLTVNSFGQSFASGSVVLEPGTFTLGNFGASVDGPITFDVLVFPGFCDPNPPTFQTVEVSGLVWTTPPGQPTTTTVIQNGPGYHFMSKALARESTVTGTITGAINFDLQTADNAVNGVIRERVQN